VWLSKCQVLATLWWSSYSPIGRVLSPKRDVGWTCGLWFQFLSRLVNSLLLVWPTHQHSVWATCLPHTFFRQKRKSLSKIKIFKVVQASGPARDLIKLLVLMLLQSVHKLLPSSRKMDIENPSHTLPAWHLWQSVSSSTALVKKSQRRFWLARLGHVIIPMVPGAGCLTLTIQMGILTERGGSVSRPRSSPKIKVLNTVILFLDLLPSVNSICCFLPPNKVEKLSFLLSFPSCPSLNSIFIGILSSSTDCLCMF
jgi:hypothetical protein